MSSRGTRCVHDVARAGNGVVMEGEGETHVWDVGVCARARAPAFVTVGVLTACHYMRTRTHAPRAFTRHDAGTTGFWLRGS